MGTRALVLRSLSYYWRTNAAVVLGVATAVAVLAGALLVGDSVRGSLRDLVLQRLGRTGDVLVSTGFFRESLAESLRSDGSIGQACPIVAMEGIVSDQASGRRASGVQVYGVDDRFWRFHGVSDLRGPEGRDALINQTLATDIGLSPGGTVLVRVERPSAIPIESLHGRKDDAGRTLRLGVRAIVDPPSMGDFSLRSQQGSVRAVFVPLKRLQQDLDLQGRVNTVIMGQVGQVGKDGTVQALEAAVRRHFALEDVGLSIRPVAAGVVQVESPAGVIDAARAKAVDEAAAAEGLAPKPVLTYLANTMRTGGREMPYSLVTAMDLALVAPAGVTAAGKSPIVLNQWAARDLGARIGDPLTLEYFAWEEPGQLVTRSAEFQIAAVVPIEGAAADRNLTPVYPGISDAPTLGDWDPPFPIDLRRIRPIDEDYWKQYRTTPKAFVPLEVGQSLWRTRYGDRTGIRLAAPDDGKRFAGRLRDAVDPFSAGMLIRDTRAESLAASRGATDFGEYFTYFSFFLVSSALVIAALFFRLLVEQRSKEIGLLRAVGFSTQRIRRLFTIEGASMATVGSVLGSAGAILYAAVMMVGLRTWWVGAVATTALTLHVSLLSLVSGAAATLGGAVICIWWTLRSLARLSDRGLLAGDIAAPKASGSPGRSSLPVYAAIGFATLGFGLMIASAGGAIDRTGAFFGAGTAWLIACFCFVTARLRRSPRSTLAGHGWRPLVSLGLRNAAVHPGRSLLAIGVIASATFILISVDAFRREGPPSTDRHGGTGGYPLLVNLLLPIANDPNSRDGRESLGLTGADDVRLEPIRVLPGDDASCLNLYQPRNPRVLGVRQPFIEAGRFGFETTIAATDAERANPWLLLNRDVGDGAVPVIADANSMTYVLHKSLGEDIVIDRGGRSVRLRLVAALADSIFQSELLMSEANFLRVFPEQAGYRFLLIDVDESRAAAIAAAIEERAADFGADAVLTASRLAEFHTVENTYLATFKTLGGLGLLVGTLGLAAVLLRNVLERRRELALLGATGYRHGHIFAIVISENVLMLGWGLAIGTVCALVAIAPAAMVRGGSLPAARSAAGLLIAVFASGLISSIVATRAALRAPLVETLRSE